MAYKDLEKQRLQRLRYKEKRNAVGRKYGKSPKGIATRLLSYKKHVAAQRAKVWVIKRGPCADCHQTFHPEAMEFDHVRGEKGKNISRLVVQRTPTKKLDEELAKCDLVCANCHRVRTYERRIK
jgi:5-methylcytosine-specific restriction endonuclease McrA